MDGLPYPHLHKLSEILCKAGPQLNMGLQYSRSLHESDRLATTEQGEEFLGCNIECIDFAGVTA